MRFLEQFKFSQFPNNVEEFFRIQEDFFSDHFVDVSSKYADSGYEIREHAKLLGGNKIRHSLFTDFWIRQRKTEQGHELP